MIDNLRRPVIRIALLTGAWCCGFLLYFFVGESVGRAWSDCSIAGLPDRIWQGYNNMLLERLSHSGLSEKAFSQVAALTLGRRDFLSEEVKEIYRMAGASHLLALSGMHLGILYGIFRLLIKNTSHTRWCWTVVAVLISVIWCYALMTGMPMSLTRAALMITIALILQGTKRRTGDMDILICSMCVLFLLDPGALGDCGFQLSCAAMMGILVLGKPLLEKFRNLPLPIRWVADGLSISVSAQIATLPLTLWYFNSIATLGAVTSLITIPLTTLIIYSSIGVYMGITCMVPVLEYMVEVQNLVMQAMGEIPLAYIII